MLNKVSLIGRLGRDPEVRRLNNGERVVNIRLATWDRWKDKQTGERKERTEWHSVVIYNDALAGVVEQYAKKGHLLYVEGQLQTRKWQDQQGQEKYTTEIVLQKFNGDIRLMPTGGGSDDETEEQRPAPRGLTNGRGSPDRQGTPNQRPGSQMYNDLDDDIPF